MNGDLNPPARQPLSRAKIKRNPPPSPVVNPYLHRREGWRRRPLRNPLFFSIARHRLPFRLPSSVLAEDDRLLQSIQRKRPDRTKDFPLFISHPFGLKRLRRFHGCHGEKLKHMVL